MDLLEAILVAYIDGVWVSPVVYPECTVRPFAFKGLMGESCLLLGRKELVDPREGKETVAPCPQWWWFEVL